MGKPILFVAGLGRCGTSLMMNMLDRGGIPCAGTYPGYEIEEMRVTRVSAEFVRNHKGHAIKWLDPFQSPVPRDIDWITIWLDRDANEQAKSQGKMAGFSLDRRQRKILASRLLKDRSASYTAFGDRPHLIVCFEDLLAHPEGASHRLAGWLFPWFGGLDEPAMASAVVPRSAQCQPGFDIEMAAIGRAAS